MATSPRDPAYNIAVADIPEGLDADGVDALANARLVVMAPDLLEALRERVEYACRWSCGHDQAMRFINHSPECRVARAAIAKAEVV